jgi:hypothetical protein
MKIAVHDIVTDVETPLDDHARVRFGEGDHRITVAVRDGVVEISGHMPLVIKPVVGNVVLVKACRRFEDVS